MFRNFVECLNASWMLEEIMGSKIGPLKPDTIKTTETELRLLVNHYSEEREVAFKLVDHYDRNYHEMVTRDLHLSAKLQLELRELEEVNG